MYGFPRHKWALVWAYIAGSSWASATAGRSGDRISNVEEEGRMEYAAVPEPAHGSSRSAKSPVTGIKKGASLLSGPMPRKCFEVVSPVDDPRKSYVDDYDSSFSAALDRDDSQSRRRIRCDRGAAPFFQFGKKE